MKRVLTTLVFLLLCTSMAYSAGKVHIFGYHTFVGGKSIYDYSIDELKSHMQLFKKQGFKFVSAYDVINNRCTGEKNILVTIDDGSQSVYRAYKEVFKPMGIRPLLAIYPNIIGKRDYVLTWGQLRELANNGCDIASHGYFHEKMSRKFYTKNYKRFLFEITGSKKKLEKELGKRIDVFVYPFGLFIDEVFGLLKKEGYRYGITIIGRPAKLPLAANGNLFAIPRYMLVRGSSKSVFSHIIRTTTGREVKVVDKIPAKKRKAAMKSTEAPKPQKKSIETADADDKPVKKKPALRLIAVRL